MTKPLLPGSTIGMLGSGQLGRMSAQAARQLGYGIVVLSPEEVSPTGHVADRTIVGPLDDAEAYRAVAAVSDVLTYEFENVSSAPLVNAEKLCPVAPHPSILHTTQHRLREKEALQALGIPIAEYKVVNSVSSLNEALDQFERGVLKTVTGGYDGKGQAFVHRDDQDLAATYASLSQNGLHELIIERFVVFQRELSIIVARGASGRAAAFPCVENIHRNGILHVSIAPARVTDQITQRAEHIAHQIAEGMDLVGVMGIEMFETQDSDLLVNELAPRPHNSGHYTLDACHTSQFEQHIRAIVGLPLGSPDQHSAAVMLNILGEHIPLLYEHLNTVLDNQAIKLHLYGKGEARPGRKMGHLTALGTTTAEAIQHLESVWVRLRVDDSPLL